MKSKPRIIYRELNGRIVSPLTPKLWDSERIKTRDFVSGLRVFSEQHLTGAALVEIEGDDLDGYLKIAPQVFAHVLKLAIIYADMKLLQINVVLNDAVTVTLSYKGSRISPELIIALLRYASKSGFEASSEDGKLRLVAPKHGMLSTTLRAGSWNDFVGVLFAHFFA